MANATLYVVFHGSWSFFQSPDYIYAKTPDMGEDHTYRAGNWLAENSIRRGSLHWFMKNIQGGTATVDRTLNPVIVNAKLAGTTHRGTQTTWIFKTPIAIYSLGQLTLKAGSLASDTPIWDQSNIAVPLPPPFTVPLTASLIQVFEYQYDPNNTLALPSIDGFPWQPIAIDDLLGYGKFATLHLFAEHERKESASEPISHLAEAYRYGALMLNADFQLDPSPGNVCLRDVQADLPKGLAARCFELEPLRARTDRMGELGQLRATLHYEQGKKVSEDLRSVWATDTDGCPTQFMRAFSCPPPGPDGDTPTCLPNWGGGTCP